MKLGQIFQSILGCCTVSFWMEICEIIAFATAMQWVEIFYKRGKFGFWYGATPLCYIILNLFQWQRKKNLAVMCHILCLVKTNKPKKVKITTKPPVLFHQKGKCRIIWYCPIAVKGEVCGNYWTVLDSSPPVFPLLLKIQPSWCDEETWPDQKKDKRQYIFSPFENPHDDDQPGDDTLSISILICHILLIKFYGYDFVYPFCLLDLNS